MSNPSAADPAPEACYRHPDRPTYIRCQRCGRPICPECQTPAAVGVHCPNCVREAHAATPRASGIPRSTNPVARYFGGVVAGGAPIVTFSLIAACVVVYGLQFLTKQALTEAWIYYPPLTATQPWRMITSAFLHSPGTVLHILFNMYALFVFGPVIEHLLGRWRFLALYLIAAFAGSVGVLLLAPGTAVLGASGAIFGLLGALLIVHRGLGGNPTQIIVVIGINLALGFFIAGVAWQAHVGGLIGGAAVAGVYMATRHRSKRNLQILGVAGVVAALVALTLLGISIHF